MITLYQIILIYIYFFFRKKHTTNAPPTIQVTGPEDESNESCDEAAEQRGEFKYLISELV